jgi:hypothetical protein
MKNFLIIILFFIQIPLVSAGMIEFLPEKNEIGRGLYCQLGKIEEDIIKLEIFKNELADELFGLSFDLEFDNNQFEFKDIQINVQNDKDDYLLISKIEKDKLIFAISAKKSNTLKFFENQNIFTIFLKLKNIGDSYFTFSNVYIYQNANANKILKTQNLDLVGAKILIPKEFQSLPQVGTKTSLYPLFISIFGIVLISLFSFVILKIKHIKK